jgi:membrane protease YdiL (CAAX protease family)
MVLFGFLLRTYAEQNAAAAMGTDPLLLQQLLRVPDGLESWQNMGWMLGAAAGVTGARLLLLSQWEEFRQATNRSNKQVLTPLSWGDIAVVSLLTGVSEELLFRSGLIPASFPDWRGAVAAGLVFGLLHNSGGRNLAFAAWASMVGVVYGAAFLVTSNIWVPAGAHVLANFASAAAWRLRLVRQD